MDTKEEQLSEVIADRLEETRRRTRWLLSTVPDEDLSRQHDPIMSPLIWDYGHIGNYEELWLLERAFGEGLSNRSLYDMYDASLHPREERPSLNLLGRGGADVYLDAIREAALGALEAADLEGEDPLLKDGFVYHMILQHECQHNETMLQTFQLMLGEGYRPQSRIELPEGNPTDEMVHIPGGPFIMGTDDRAWALDNE
jgi:gamma-glutamyl hercynylcysteine S-oxide synthase